MMKQIFLAVLLLLIAPSVSVGLTIFGKDIQSILGIDSPARVAGVQNVSPAQTLILEDNTNNYTIENDYYKAVLLKGGQFGSGLVRELYVKKEDLSWSQNLVYAGASLNYGLGYLEGVGDATSNRYTGFSNLATVVVTSQTATEIVITSTLANSLASNLTEIWTFYAGLPYFKSEAVVENISGNYVTNQYQFPQMINSTLPSVWTGTDESGSVKTFPNQVNQPLFGLTDTYPWVNWSFTGETVSLGTIFTDLPYGVNAVTGDWAFEYQLNFNLGGGFQGNPTKPGFSRYLTTMYYTSDSASDASITSFASSEWSEGEEIVKTATVQQAAQYLTNAYGQRAGISSSLVSEPYFLVRQNASSGLTTLPQYTTWIYSPLFALPKSSQVSWGADYTSNLEFTLNYNNGATDYTYGTVSSASVQNGATTSLTNNAASSDGEVAYTVTFATWDDSDKLQITGTASNGDASSTIKDIWANIDVVPFYVEVEKNADNSTDQIKTPASDTLTQNDGRWDTYTGYTSLGIHQYTLVYRDNGETVQPLMVSCPAIIPGNQYRVYAVVKQSSAGSATYQYSLDGITYTPFVVPQGGVAARYTADLGTITMPTNNFYINDDDSTSGAVDYMFWDRVAFVPIIKEIAAGHYDLQWHDEIHGNIGVGIKVNTPAGATITTDGLNVYLNTNEAAQNTTTFSHAFDVELHPHIGLYDQSSDFGTLHTKTEITYPWRQ